MTAPSQLDPSHYTQGEPFMREKSQLFAREWLPICAASQLPQPGDYLGHVIGGWPVVAVRDTSGTRLFRNTCRHQNMMVLDKPAGNCSIIQCRYHGWQYQLDGTFAAAPPLVAPPENAARGANDLHGLGMYGAGSFLFGHLQVDAAPPTLDDVIASKLAQRFTAVHAVDIGCNWKVLAEYFVANALPYQWPLLAARDVVGATQVLQIIPRSFVRTRVVSYAIAADEAAPSAAEQAAQAVQQDRLACEALQARYALGELDALIAADGGASRTERADRIGAFRRRVLDALVAA